MNMLKEFEGSGVLYESKHFFGPSIQDGLYYLTS